MGFRDSLTPLSTNKVREHQVLHVACDLENDDSSMQRAQKEILRWAQKRSGGRLPVEAMAGKAFDLLVGGRSSSAVVVDLPEIQAWALRQEDPDKTVPGRIWTSEAILWKTQETAPRFAARLVVGSAEQKLDISPAVPGYVMQLSDRVGLFSGSQAVTTRPKFIGSQDEQDNLIELLEDPARQLPVIVVAAVDRKNPGLVLDVDRLASGLCGLAHLAVILPETSWVLTERFGGRLSVFDRGIRIYMPGFGIDSDEYAHPLWVGGRLVRDKSIELVDRQIRGQIAQFSTRMVRLGSDILPFAQLRSYARKVEQDRLAASGASDSEKLSAAENRIAALTRELAEAKDLEQYALDEEARAQRRADDAENRERNATAQIQVLLQRLTESGDDHHEAEAFPASWSDFEDWCDRALVGRIALTSAARRGCKKAIYVNIEQVCRCMTWLATECRDRFLEGGGPLRDKPVMPGIKNSLCGGDEFSFSWQSQDLNANWHIKTGGNTRSPEKCLRIYYTWDGSSQQIIIADMPAHRRTSAS